VSPASICVQVPEDCSDDAAVMAQPFAVALHATRRARVEDGAACLVIGVGGIGTFVVAAAAAHGAAPLIAADVDERRLQTARSVGAHETVDVRRPDALTLIADLAGGGVEIAIEASGTPQGLELALAATAKGGRVVLVGLQAAPRELDVFSLAVREIEVVGTLAHVCAVDLPEAVQLLATTRLAETVRDRVIPLDALVEDGLAPLAEGKAGGKIVVDVTA
jgi:(R,R)-butanediol dehydrogenase / meso-butanediol dehydrogenase / diacetyl reductase